MVEAVMSKEVWCSQRYSVTTMRKLHANKTEMSHLTSTGWNVRWATGGIMWNFFFLFSFFDLGKTGHSFSEIQLGHCVVCNITLERNREKYQSWRR